eukprot:gnl/TRDRNA2_/TRDRNA2_35424_c0_seq1.p1 gnl/TRDRNA2_/TRDRNA2_35424_c0~~gnl/TRDRNA2_/TRDRNA2_35424_c0_seq1.p1  ORF type:complete len:374 (+),score=44.20 gnl/TRDRNA2_/TRDRNA2_35424_c0_seq1:75-1196(+)
MLVPTSSSASLAVALLSMCCWGSWSNALKWSDGLIRFEIFYMNFSLSLLVTSLFAGLTLGMVRGSGKQGSRLYSDDWHLNDPDRYLFAFAAGFVFNVANLCLCKGITMLGLSLAFPICIGTALVLGTLVTYAVQPSGHFGLLLLGVIVAFIAVCTAALAQHLKDQQPQVSQKENLVAIPAAAPQGSIEVTSVDCARTVSSTAASGPSLCRRLSVCVVGGVLMGLWNPLVTLAEKDPGLSAYGELTFYTMAVALSSFFFMPLLLAWPLEGGPSTPVMDVLREYRTVPAHAHLCSIGGGAVWTLGTLSNAVAGNSGVLSSAESYAIGQCANMIAILWGALYFKEFQGTNATVKALLVLVCALYAGAIVCITASST